MKIRHVLFNEFPPFQKGSLVTFPELNQDKEVAEIHLITGVNGTGKTRFLSFLESGFGGQKDLANRGIVLSLDVGIIGIDTKQGAKAWSGGRFLTTLPKWNLSDLSLNGPSQGTSGFFHNHCEGFGLSFRGSLRIEDSQIQSQAPVDLGQPQEHLSFDQRPNEESQKIAQAIANIVSMGSQEIAQNVQGGKYAQLLNKVNQSLEMVLGSKTAFFVDSQTQKQLFLSVLVDGNRIALSHLPDGLRSIIAWLFATVAKLETTFPDDEDPLKRHFTMFLDEPETHLHPAWQRYVLRIAQELFPNAQIFVATHSPFIISSINSGWIHVLRKNEKRKVEFEDPIPCSEGDTYMDVVEDVLGISERYDPETESLLEKYRKLREKVLSSDFEGESELRKLMLEIGNRSESLQHMMGREMYQLNKAMAS